MNGEVMEESIENPQLSQNEISRRLQLEAEDEDGNEEKPMPGLEEQTDGEKSDIISKEGKETIPASEKNIPNPIIGEEEVENRELHLHRLEELCQADAQTTSTTSTNEDAHRAPSTSTNGLENNEEDKHINIKLSLEHESEFENSNSFQEKINSKDSSMLSTTDTQDEIDTVDNGDQLFAIHLKNRTEECSINNRDEKESLDMEMESEDSLEDILGSDLDPQTEETFSIVSGSEYDEASQDSVHGKSNDIILLETNGPATQNVAQEKSNDVTLRETNAPPTQDVSHEKRNDVILLEANASEKQNISHEKSNDVILLETSAPATQDVSHEKSNDVILLDTPTPQNVANEKSNDVILLHTPAKQNVAHEKSNDVILLHTPAKQNVAREKSNDVIVLEDTPTKQNPAHKKSNVVNLLETNAPSTQNGTKSPEVHEINSDNDDEDCIVTAENIKTENKKKATNTELRRSSRTIKRKKYSYSFDNEEESDIEEVTTEDQLRRKSRPIMINDTKSLVEIAAKRAARSTSAQRREPQLVLIGSNPIAKTTSINRSISSNMNTSLYQSIVARGTTVTPVPSKQVAAPTTPPSQVSQASQTPAPAILPSLTDDMFVVEAPSFIVPYVYEKPSIEPFKEFVINLGKELEEQRTKTEKELVEKKKEEKIKRQKERQDKRDRGEDVEDSDEEARREAEENKKRKIEKKELRRRQKEEDDESWDGSDSTDSEDFKITDEDGRTILYNDKVNPIEEAKGDLQIAPASISKSENYFDCSLGKFFINIGMGLVEEYVQTDLLKQQKRKLQREKKSEQSTKERELSICLLTKNLELSKENNKPYTCSQLKCEHCSFKTESALVLAQHLETPHMKNNMYKCNFCEFEIRSPHDILFHMEAEHNVRGKLERAPSYHQCCNCPFEDNGKGKLARHLVACAKKFKPEQNLDPPVEWEPPAKIPKVAKVRSTMLGSPFTSTANPFGRPQFGSSFGRPPIVTGMIPGMSNYRPRGRFPGPAVPRPVQAGGSIVRGSSMLKQSATASVTSYSLGNSKKSSGQPSISITPLPRQPAPVNVQAGQNSKGTFVICEICDGYIKDLDQLRNHMQWIHKVKIHPKMIYNRPPLNCQKCQFRFFTDQGLERHLLGSHGLVTSSMQEAANKSKDAGRCPVCGKVYQWKLLNHVAKDHNMTLKPAHLSYKCTVCTATFGMYKLFENHVYSAHSIVAKRVMDKNTTAKAKANAPKGFEINDEITITAQPAMGLSVDAVKKDK